MPINKNAFMRYQLLDYCFHNKRYNIEQLVDYVSDKLGYNISLRQIREDISNMKLDPYDAPIKAVRYEGNKAYYVYTDPSFSLFDNEMSPEELKNLRATIDMLGRYRGLPANAWLEEVISSLEIRFGVKPNSEKLISFAQNDMLKGAEHLSGIIDATINHQVLEIIYHSFGKEARACVVHPYYVKQYNGRWFLFGLNSENDKIENYALDRIVSFEKSDISFIKNEKINFETYFDDVIGVSVPYEEVPTEEIVLRFSPQRFPYVVSKPLHHSQKICEEPNTISICVKPTRELTQQIFSFLPDIEVLSPEWYRKEIRTKMEENLKKYQSI
ncbi:helix-turn-helix transcriptional regulator [Segatella albensis]|jgi:predicted DNA-binding transcriptional regulator YafY|uniref:helix-turn-helix transcriptional regulator n=1 Tax=Segatella albensis TaxID=77768 RepID=UPI00041CAF63|nr:WYL domain-containing protein [Segatella albensis]